MTLFKKYVIIDLIKDKNALFKKIPRVSSFVSSIIIQYFVEVIEMTKREFINELLKLNPNMSKVGTSDVWMGKPDLVPVKGGGFKMVNMTTTIPLGASIERGYIVSFEGHRVKLWQP